MGFQVALEGLGQRVCGEYFQLQVVVSDSDHPTFFVDIDTDVEALIFETDFLMLIAVRGDRLSFV
jgi:hypothetical protein